MHFMSSRLQALATAGLSWPGCGNLQALLRALHALPQMNRASCGPFARGVNNWQYGDCGSTWVGGGVRSWYSETAMRCPHDSSATTSFWSAPAVSVAGMYYTVACHST